MVLNASSTLVIHVLVMFVFNEARHEIVGSNCLVDAICHSVSVIVKDVLSQTKRFYLLDTINNTCKVKD